MALFPKADPVVQAQSAAESALRAKRRDRDGLIERLTVSEAAAVSYRQKARQLAGEGGDDAAIAKLEAQMRSAQDRAVTLTGAIADIDQVIAGLEREVEAIIDRRMRAATSAAVGAMADRIFKAQGVADEALKELEAATAEGGLIVPESKAVSMFTDDANAQLKPAVEMVVGALRGHAQGVLSGHAPASLPRPAPEPVKLALVKPIATQNIFALKNLKYRNAQGGVTCIGANKRHDLPEALAALAIASRLALPLTEKKLIAELGQNASVYDPDPSSCSWVGEKGPEAPVRSARPGGPALHSSFEEYDRGGPYTATFTRPPEPMGEPLAVGARKLDAEE